MDYCFALIIMAGIFVSILAANIFYRFKFGYLPTKDCIFGFQSKAFLHQLLVDIRTSIAIASADIIFKHGSDAIDFLDRCNKQKVASASKNPNKSSGGECQLLDRIERDFKMLQNIRQYQEDHSND